MWCVVCNLLFFNVYDNTCMFQHDVYHAWTFEKKKILNLCCRIQLEEVDSCWSFSIIFESARSTNGAAQVIPLKWHFSPQPDWRPLFCDILPGVFTYSSPVVSICFLPVFFHLSGCDVLLFLVLLPGLLNSASLQGMTQLGIVLSDCSLALGESSVTTCCWHDNRVILSTGSLIKISSFYLHVPWPAVTHREAVPLRKVSVYIKVCFNYHKQTFLLWKTKTSNGLYTCMLQNVVHLHATTQIFGCSSIVTIIMTASNKLLVPTDTVAVLSLASDVGLMTYCLKCTEANQQVAHVPFSRPLHSPLPRVCCPRHTPRRKLMVIERQLSCWTYLHIIII